MEGRIEELASLYDESQMTISRLEKRAQESGAILSEFKAAAEERIFSERERAKSIHKKYEDLKTRFKQIRLNPSASVMDVSPLKENSKMKSNNEVLQSELDILKKWHSEVIEIVNVTLNSIFGTVSFHMRDPQSKKLRVDTYKLQDYFSAIVQEIVYMR